MCAFLSFMTFLLYFSGGHLWFNGLRFCCKLRDDDHAGNHETSPPFFCQIDTPLACLYYDALPCVFFLFVPRNRSSTAMPHVFPSLDYACTHLVVQYTIKNSQDTMIALSRAPTRAANNGTYAIDNDCYVKMFCFWGGDFLECPNDDITRQASHNILSVL